MLLVGTSVSFQFLVVMNKASGYKCGYMFSFLLNKKLRIDLLGHINFIRNCLVFLPVLKVASLLHFGGGVPLPKKRPKWEHVFFLFHYKSVKEF